MPLFDVRNSPSSKPSATTTAGSEKIVVSRGGLTDDQQTVFPSGKDEGVIVLRTRLLEAFAPEDHIVRKPSSKKRREEEEVEMR